VPIHANQFRLLGRPTHIKKKCVWRGSPWIGAQSVRQFNEGQEDVSRPVQPIRA